MTPERQSGVLLHPSSLPGPYGIGDLGPAALRWLDFLHDAGQSVWQILPLGPAGYADSPYQCFSVFAGNPWLISPDVLFADGLLNREEMEDHPAFDPGRADYGGAMVHKRRILRTAYGRFRTGSAPALRGAWQSFRMEEAAWLDDFTLYLAVKRAHAERPWWEWERGLALCRPQALRHARKNLAQEIDQAAFEQFLFLRQWESVRRHARERGIRIIGDAPLYAATDSAEVWMHKELFALDGEGHPTAVAGVPPDYFSATGQLWGNPLYRWEAHAADGYRWWAERMRAALRLCDAVRLDHFRGLQAYWEVPAGAPTAETGRWVPGPGADLLRALDSALGGLPFIAEDLGVITGDVTALRDAFGLPGMRVLQFAFGDDSDNPFLPHNYEPHTVVYTGTHDNDTTRGWYASLSESERDRVRRYLARDGSDIAWDILRLAWASVARTAVAPLQDVLDLGSDARMNHPGRAMGNWTWRFREDALKPETGVRLRELTALYGRLSDGEPQ
jgi:4-alpha-glucanotransferase